jgi:exopolysaccharide biosynthesis polyprenyl glycosylphosphotransferase
MDWLARRGATAQAELGSQKEAEEEWRRPAVTSYDGLLEGPEQPSRRDSVRRRLLALGDVAGLLVAFALAELLLGSRPGPPLVLLVVVPLWVLMNKLVGLYDRDANLIHKSTLDELPAIALSVVLGTSLTFMLAPPLLGFDVDRAEALAFLGLALVLVPTCRGLARRWVGQHFPPEHCLIVGSGFVADVLARKITCHPEYGVRLVGFVDAARDDQAHQNGELRSLGDLDDFEDVCREHAVQRVVIAFSSLSHEGLIDAIKRSKALQLKITVVPRLFEVIGHSVEVDQLEGMTLLGLRGFTRTRSSMALKRAIDIAVAGGGLLVLSPVLLLVALAVKLDSRGPVLFCQERIGRGNRSFGMYKFRTMVDGAEALREDIEHLNEAVSPMFKITADPRVTRVGRFLRRTSLDELPQLWNVLRGEMSLVGPRPLIPFEDDHVIGFHRERLDLTPGLTGPWQVLGRTVIPFQEMVKLDYLYVAEWSLWNDIKLLVRTAPIVFQGRGR